MQLSDGKRIFTSVAILLTFFARMVFLGLFKICQSPQQWYDFLVETHLALVPHLTPFVYHVSRDDQGHSPFPYPEIPLL